MSGKKKCLFSKCWRRDWSCLEREYKPCTGTQRKEKKHRWALLNVCAWMNCVWWCILRMPAFSWVRRKYHEFKVCLGYLGRLYLKSATKHLRRLLILTKTTRSWWHTYLIPAIWRQKQANNWGFKASRYTQWIQWWPGLHSENIHIYSCVYLKSLNKI